MRKGQGGGKEEMAEQQKTKEKEIRDI